MAYPYALPDIETRFLPNDNWQVSNFINPKTDHHIHYSFSLVENAKGTVIVLPGLSEFGEKYIETIQYLNTNNLNCFVIDWSYQGRSTRFSANTHKRHSDGYETDISDLHHLITNHIPDNLPQYMLGHSMGGHIGLRYLATQKHTIKAASFSAPMLGIKDLKYFPSFLCVLFKPFFKSYVLGGKDWHESDRKGDGTGIFSSDPVRDSIHNNWCLKNTDLQIGSVTFKWLYESLKSISILKNPLLLRNIKIPVLMACAEKESLVDNTAIIQASENIKKSHLLELKNAKHEILMEKDDIRDGFLRETLEIFNQ